MDIIIKLNKSSATPVYKQVVNGLIDLIESARLEDNSKLPSTRSLSENLGISRNTVIKAYEELEILGYVKNHPSKGSYVSCANPNVVNSTEQDSQPVDLDSSILSQYGNRIMFRNDIEYGSTELIDELNQSAPVQELLPVNQWHKNIQASIRDKSYLNLNNKDVFGNMTLRVQLAKYLGRTRALNCHPEQICLFNSTQSGLDILVRTIIDEGDKTIVEEPGFPGARRTFACYGALVESMKVDKDGADVDELLKHKTAPPKLIYVTPNHHDPLGVVLSEERRRKLISWVNNQNCFIIEDDFDSDYRYNEKPPIPLKTLDYEQKVIYLSSFWKLLFPVTCLGFMVLPEPLIPLIKRAKELCERDLDRLEHYALASFIENGNLEKHIKRTRKIYAKRRTNLVQSLNKFLSGYFNIYPVAAGTHLILAFDKLISADTIMEAAQNANLPLVASTPFYLNEKLASNNYILPFAYMDEDYMLDAIEAFASVMKKNSSI